MHLNCPAADGHGITTCRVVKARSLAHELHARTRRGVIRHLHGRKTSHPPRKLLGETAVPGGARDAVPASHLQSAAQAGAPPIRRLTTLPHHRYRIVYNLQRTNTVSQGTDRARERKDPAAHIGIGSASVSVSAITLRQEHFASYLLTYIHVGMYMCMYLPPSLSVTKCVSLTQVGAAVVHGAAQPTSSAGQAKRT